MRFNKSLAVAGALGLAVLTAGPALAEPVPADPQTSVTPETPKPETAEKKAPETKAPETSKPETGKPGNGQTPENKPSEQAAEERHAAVKIGLSTYEAKAGDQVTVRAHASRFASTVTFSSDLFGTKTVATDRGFAEYTFTVPAQADSGTFKVTAATRYTSASADLKVTHVAKELKLGLSTYEAKAGDQVTVRAHVDSRAGDVIFSSDLFGAKPVQAKGDSDGYAVAEYTFTVPAQADSGTFAVRADAGRYGKDSRDLKVSEKASIEPRIGMKDKVVRGEQVVVDVAGDLREGTAILSGDAFERVYHVPLKDQGNGVGRGQVTVTIAKDAKLGYSEVRADFGRWGKAVGSITVGESATPIVGVGVTLDPSTVVQGKSTTASVTTKAVADGTVVKVKWAGGEIPATVKDGKAVAVLNVPADAAVGASKVVAVLPSGQVSAPATLTVVAAPVPAASVALRLEPPFVHPGQSYYAGVTTKNVKPGTWVTVKDPGGKKHYAKLDAYGTARVKLTAPKSVKPGRYTVLATVAGKSGTATLTVVKPAPKAQVDLVLSTNKVNAGGKFSALVLTKHVGKGTATIVDPNGKHFTVKLNGHGVGGKKFYVPTSVKPGTYWFKVYVNGASDAEKLTVKPKVVAQSLALTPQGGAATGGGLSGSPLAGVALGGLLIAGGVGSALFGRRKAEQA
ncbi:hypothetical protein ACIBG7_02455 [Nonomuraea sp. NPDC050328]|uniref:hypothetical protein n=1 Tax=Nonomuraea sp. NPDC050328 TaxID=3364361 RepID=UPI0037B308B2